MIAIVQRVSEASVSIGGNLKSKIEKGYLVLLGIHQADSSKDIDYLIKKITGLRVFSDEKGKMNLSIKDIKGEILLISQFTLLANTKKGNRPSFIEAAKPEIAIPLYEKFILQLTKELEKEVQTGAFGADMQVSLINDGPVTITLNSDV